MQLSRLFSNPEDNGLMDKPVVNLAKDQKELTKKLLNTPPSNTKYQLQSVICHKGTSPHTGHYVVFIRKQIQGEYKWVLFNDEKVVVCDETNLDDIKNNGYVYVFEQVKTQRKLGIQRDLPTNLDGILNLVREENAYFLKLVTGDAYLLEIVTEEDLTTLEDLATLQLSKFCSVSG